jgi:hypothetical protein
MYSIVPTTVFLRDEAPVIHQLRDAEVEHLHVILRRHEHVVGLEIAMNRFVVVGSSRGGNTGPAKAARWPDWNARPKSLNFLLSRSPPALQPGRASV